MLRALILTFALLSSHSAWADQDSYLAKADPNLQRAFQKDPTGTFEISIQLKWTDQEQQRRQAFADWLPNSGQDVTAQRDQLEMVDNLAIEMKYITLARLSCRALLKEKPESPPMHLKLSTPSRPGSVIAEVDYAAALVLAASDVVDIMRLNLSHNATAGN